MLAAKRGLRVAPVPPKTADLTRPGRPAKGTSGRDEGTAVLIEPRNNQRCASWPCRQGHPPLTVEHPMVGETVPHTQKFGFVKSVHANTEQCVASLGLTTPAAPAPARMERLNMKQYPGCRFWSEPRAAPHSCATQPGRFTRMSLTHCVRPDSQRCPLDISTCREPL